MGAALDPRVLVTWCATVGTAWHCRLEGAPRELLVGTLQRVLVEEGVLPAGYDFEAHKQLVPMQPGDVPVTYADTTALQRDLGYKPATPLEDGLRAFAKWYYDYYKC